MSPQPFRSAARTTAVTAGTFGFATLALAALVCAGAAPASAAIVSEPVEVIADASAFDMHAIGSYESGIFDESAAEIVAYYAAGQRMLVVNAAQAKVEVLSIADPAAPVKLFDLQTTGVASADGSVVSANAVANSVSVRADGLGAIAVEDDPKTGAGWVVFFDAAGDGKALGAVRAGALPDMITFSPDGSRVIVANEGEPAEDYSVDPEGSISIIDVPSSVTAPAQSAVRSAGFHAFEAGGSIPLDPQVRIYGGREDAGTGTPEFPVSENLEPEYATFSADGSTAWVSLQEANALAVVDTASATVTGILPLGTVDRMTVPIDASDRDEAINIRTWPVLGMYQPDAVASYESAGQTYIVTANEGDSRDWEGYSEVARVKDLGEDGLAPVCATAFDDVLGTEGLPATFDDLLADEALGRLNITTANGFDEAAGCYDTLYTYGARSFSIWSADGAQVFDSADAFEQLSAVAAPEFFNSNHTASDFDGRSDDKGPEPEGLAVGAIGDRTYAFVGFERVGGIAAFDVTDPAAPTFAAYVNNRDFAASVEEDPTTLAEAGDLGPEGLKFIPAAESPTGSPMVAVGNEVSGTTTLFEITVPDAAPAPVPTGTPAPTPAPTTPAPTPVPTTPAPTSPAPTTTAAPVPGEGAGSGADGTSGSDGELASTGVNAWGTALPAALVLAAGLAAMITVRVRRRNSNSSGTNRRSA